jgi:hypothetical protein
MDIGGEADSTDSGFFFSALHAHLAIFPRQLTLDELYSINQAMHFGYPIAAGINDAIQRKLYYVNWIGSRVLNTTSFGPGSDILGTSPIAEKIASIADYSMGSLFSDATGQLQFRAHDRAATQTSRAVLGDRPDLGEIPYIGDAGNLETDFDPTFLYNKINVSNSGILTSWNPGRGIQNYTVINSASAAKYGLRTLGKDISLYNSSDGLTIANNLLAKYALPKQRVSSVLIDVLTSQQWVFALSVEVGDFVTFKRRPIGAPAITINCIVLNITHTVDPPSKWELKLVLAPQ